jgi:hypothetical protein
MAYGTKWRHSKKHIQKVYDILQQNKIIIIKKSFWTDGEPVSMYILLTKNKIFIESYWGFFEVEEKHLKKETMLVEKYNNLKDLISLWRDTDGFLKRVSPNIIKYVGLPLDLDYKKSKITIKEGDK